MRGISEIEGGASSRKEQFLAIAAEMFARQGFDRTKVSDIVAAAEVSQGTFYWYFKSKESIAQEILLEGRQRLLDVVASGYRQSAVSVQESVKASEELFVKLLRFAEEHPYFMEILFKGIHSQPAIQHTVDSIRKELWETFANNIRRAGELMILPNAHHPDRLAAFLMSLVDGTITRWLFMPEGEMSPFEGMSVEEIAKELAAFEFFGLLGI